ncbi:hypothetical protein PIB30_014851 [Stylosanthes scabra]|uniref:TraB family protein n=1 Tax=Stylosanthes scabra TaxID=79078 RepID=A0ABU6S6Q3_9FABA|nr:hypothetical protein [Stylosanthes scabra]
MRKCSTIPSSEKKLMTGLPEHIVPLKLGFCHVYLVGTVHRSQKSVADVQRMVRALEPDVVFLELCEERRQVLTRKEISSERKIITPGSEFRIAYEEAIKYGGKVILGDRPYEVTLKRAWRKIALSEFINAPRARSLRFPFDDFREGFIRYDKEYENMKMDIINSCQVLSKIIPTYAETYIHERDIFMAKGILNEAKKSSRVVAVVGKAHLDGLKKHLQHPQQLDDLLVDDLLTVPPPKYIILKIITSINVLMAGVGIIWEYFEL